MDSGAGNSYCNEELAEIEQVRIKRPKRETQVVGAGGATCPVIGEVDRMDINGHKVNDVRILKECPMPIISMSAYLRDNGAVLVANDKGGKIFQHSRCAREALLLKRHLGNEIATLRVKNGIYVVDDKANERLLQVKEEPETTAPMQPVELDAIISAEAYRAHVLSGHLGPKQILANVKSGYFKWLSKHTLQKLRKGHPIECVACAIGNFKRSMPSAR